MYRAYDSGNVLLYLGVTTNLQQRHWGHADSSTWCQFTERLNVEWWLVPDGLYLTEQAEIERCHPLWNVTYNATSDARIRLARYLIKKDRPDLLAPILSKPRPGKKVRVWST